MTTKTKREPGAPLTPDDIAHWYRQHGTMHPIDTYDRARRGEPEALRIVARDLDGGK